MKKNSLNLTIYLIILPFIGKFLSFLSRIVLARYLSKEALSYYSVLTPTIVILISIVHMSIPSVISKFVAQKNYQFKVLSTSICFMIFTTLLTTLLYLLCIPYLTHLLYKHSFKLIFYSVIPYLPLICISGLLKGYLLGKQKYIESNISMIIEEIIRIMFLIIIFNYFEFNDPKTYAIIAILSMSIGELSSSLYMILVIYKNKGYIYRKLEYSSSTLKQILKISLPMSGSRFIGSLTYFLEPIIISLSVSKINYNSIILEYGILNGHVMPLLTLPSFLSLSFSNYLLAKYSYYDSRNLKEKANNILFIIIYICLIFSIIYYLILYFYCENICLLLYNSTEASYFLKVSSIPFILYSLQPILASIIHAQNNSKNAFIDTITGCIIRVIILAIGIPIFKEKALILALCASMLITTCMHYYQVFIKKESI